MASERRAGLKGVVAFAIVAMLLTIVGAGSGLSVGLLLIKYSPPRQAPDTTQTAQEQLDPKSEATEHTTSGQTEAAAETPTAAETEEKIDPLKLKVVAFPPVLTTLAEPKGKWIRLEGSILCLGSSDVPPDIQAEKAGEQILAYLRTVRLDQLEGPSGLVSLKEDIDEMLRTLSNGEVREVLIHGLIVE